MKTRAIFTFYQAAEPLFSQTVKILTLVHVKNQERSYGVTMYVTEKQAYILNNANNSKECNSLRYSVLLNLSW